MRVLPIQMPHQQKLCVPNTHALHVFFGDFRHFLVGELSRILRGEGQRDMSDRVFNPGVEQRLVLEVPHHVADFGRGDTLGGQNP